ncbi:MAG: hypothetical protein AAB073_07500 [Pseudomonadota bacterium]
MATLMTEDGVVLWTFSNVEEARKVWSTWCSLQKDRITNQIGYLDKSGLSE